MSHQPERTEKNCLNCGTTVAGRFCQRCGQENIVTHQSFWALVKHFVYDVLHFDGKFYHTVLYLFTRPGFVAKEFVNGRRASYLDPIRMYLFTSAVFFLLFFASDTLKLGGQSDEAAKSATRQALTEQYEAALELRPGDTLMARRLAYLRDTTRPLDLDTLALTPSLITVNGRRYNSMAEYDSIQRILPAKKRDGWLGQRIARQSIKVNQKYGRSQQGIKAFLDAFLHRLPYLLFASLPFFALILKLLYVRRKQFVYSNHAVFTLYHYIFSFILLLLLMGVSALEKTTGWSFFDFLLVALSLMWPLYLLLQMKIFYRQGWLKTTLKFVLLNLLGLVVLMVLFVAFFVFSIFQV